jgi:hypothetical protein
MTATKQQNKRWKPAFKQDDDDASGPGHRRFVGVFGMFLPLILLTTPVFRETPPLAGWPPLGSVSAYYYTGGNAVFAGVLVALSFLLLTYKGYDNKRYRMDRTVGIVAGLAAFLVAFFPTGRPDGIPYFAWSTDGAHLVHNIAAGVLFSAFAVFALVLFPYSEDETTLKERLQDPRNVAYYVCGIAIVLGIIWTLVNALVLQRSIFWPETVALVAFAVSWLVKGRIELLPGEVRELLKKETAQLS